MDVYVDRPGLGLLLTVRIALGVAVGMGMLIGFAEDADWRPISLALALLGLLVLVFFSSLHLLSMRFISYAISSEHLEVRVGDLRPRTLLLLDVREVRRVRLQLNPFRGYPRFVTRGFNLLEVVDRSGSRVHLSPGDVSAFERELTRRVAVVREARA